MTQTDELVLWTHEQKCLKAVDSLAKNGFGAVYCAMPQEAFACIFRESADAFSVGSGGSVGLRLSSIANHVSLI